MDNKEKSEVMSYDEKFLKTRSILITGEISEEASMRFAKQILTLENESKDPIYVFIDSPGGDVNAGYAIYDMIRFVDCEVFIVGMGLVASAAALILLSVDKDHRVGFANSEYLIHQPSSKMQGVASDINIHVKQIEKLKKKINEAIAEATGKAFEQVAQDTERDYWLDSAEAVEYGLISRIVNKRSEL